MLLQICVFIYISHRRGIVPNCEIRVWNMDPMNEDLAESGEDRFAHVRQLIKEQKDLYKSRDHFFATVDLSQYGSKVGFSYQNSKNLYKFTREAIALKKRLETHLKNHNTNKDSEKLLVSLEKVIYYVTFYHNATRDRPFDWIKKRFLPADKRGLKLSYPDVESDDLLVAIEPEAKCVPSDDDECETVEKDPDFSRLYLGIPNPLVYQYLQMGYGIANKDEQNIWAEFNKGTHEAEVINPEFVNGEKRSIEANHPIVNVVGNFAVATFNNACEKHVKKGEHNNLHDFEVMECKYLKVNQFYYFYMIIEGIEEGNIGTYMAEVACNSFDGASILCKFVLTDYKPSGTKAMAASYLSCLNSICKNMDGLFIEKRARLRALYTSLKDPEVRTAVYELHRLKEIHNELWGGFVNKFREHTEFHFPPDCSRKINPDFWSDPGDCDCSGMVRRAKGTTCSGYDYYNPLLRNESDPK